MLAQATYFAPGERADGLEPGDFILVHGLSLVPRLICFGQSLRFRGPYAGFAYWNHAAVYVGDGTLIEAKGRHPVQKVPLAQYDVRHYAVVHVPEADPEMRANAVKFCEAKLGLGYGYPMIFALALWSLTGGSLTIGFGPSFICSGLAAEATERFGAIYDRETASLTPAHLAEHYGIGKPC